MSDADRFLWYAAGGAAGVGLLAGVLSAFVLFGPFTLHDYLLYEASDLAARATTLVLWALWGTVGLAYVVLPLAVTGYRVRRGPDDRLHHLVRGAAALLVVPGLLAVSWVVLGNGLNRGLDPARLLVTAALVGLVATLVAGEYVTRRRRDDAPRTTTSVTFLNVAVLLVFVLAFVLGGFGAAATGATGAVTERRHIGVPQAAFDYEYEPTGDGRGVLTVTHDGGDVVAANRLHVEGDVVAVEGAEQTAEGPWQGEATGRRIDGHRSVAPGDSVTVGVSEDCVVRVVSRYAGSVATLGKYECDSP